MPKQKQRMATLRKTPKSNAMKLHQKMDFPGKRLREELHEQAKVSRQKLIRKDGTLEKAKPMPNKLRIQGNDAITRLLNVGRPHHEGFNDAAIGRVESGKRGLNEGACIHHATVRVVAARL